MPANLNDSGCLHQQVANTSMKRCQSCRPCLRAEGSYLEGQVLSVRTAYHYAATVAKPNAANLGCGVGAAGDLSSARRGYHVQATPLKGSMELVKQQADGFLQGVEDGGHRGHGQRLTMLRVGFVGRDDADAKAKQALRINISSDSAMSLQRPALYATEPFCRSSMAKPRKTSRTICWRNHRRDLGIHRAFWDGRHTAFRGITVAGNNRLAGGTPRRVQAL